MKLLPTITITALLLILTACASKPQLDDPVQDYNLVRKYVHGERGSRYDVEYTDGNSTIYIEFWDAGRMKGVKDGEAVFRQQMFDENGDCRLNLMECSTLQNITVRGQRVMTAQLPNPEFTGFLTWCNKKYIGISIPSVESLEFSRAFVGNIISNNCKS